MHLIAYASESTVEFSDADLSALLLGARAKNARFDVTGLLLYRDGRFIQVLEGSKKAVVKIYSEIAADHRHTIQVVSHHTISTRQFDGWSMGFRPPGEQTPVEDGEHDRDYRPSAPERDPSDSPGGSGTVFDRLFHQWLIPTPTKAGCADTGIRGILRGGLTKPTAVVEQTEPAPGDGYSTTSSTVVSKIYDALMSELDTGALLPGDRVNDYEIADALGTSRTPVREALQRMRSIGVVEASANRFTRISVVDVDQTAQSIAVLAGLFQVVLDEVIGHIGAAVVDQMRQDRVAFLDSVSSGDLIQIASTGATFYLRLLDESGNAALRRSISSVVHVVKLGSPHLDKLIGIETISRSQELLLAAVVAGNLVEAKRALDLLTASAVPL